MCGRYSLAAPNPAYLRERFALGDEAPLEPRFNIAPGQDAVTVTTDRSGEPRPDLLRWGLVPHWSDSPKTGYKMINARAETIEDRSAFRDALATRRCLVIADGFYEWQPREHVAKQPWWVTRSGGEPFAFAGLWAEARREDGSTVHSCTIVTCEPGEVVAPIHDRMPVILRQEDEADWLDPETGEERLQALLAPTDDLAVTEVSDAVNDFSGTGAVAG